MATLTDSRSTQGILSRGQNVYPTGYAANKKYSNVAQAITGGSAAPTAPNPDYWNTASSDSAAAVSASPDNMIGRSAAGGAITTAPSVNTGVTAAPNASVQAPAPPVASNGTDVNSGGPDVVSASTLNPNSVTVGSIGNSGNTSQDFDYNTALNNIFRDQSAYDYTSQQGADRAKSDLSTAYEAAANNYHKAQNASKEQYANNGLLYSGGFISNQSDIGEDYQRNTNALTTSAQRTFEDLASQSADRANTAAQQKLALEQQQAQAKAAQDLQNALITAQTKAYNDFKAGLTGSGTTGATGTVSTPTGPTNVGGVGYGITGTTLNADGTGGTFYDTKDLQAQLSAAQGLVWDPDQNMYIKGS